MQITTIGLDLAKSVFQVHCVLSDGSVLRKKLRRAQVLGFFEAQPASLVGMEACATHSLRRTKVALVHKKTGNLRACQLLLGHRKLEITVRYLGIEVDDALALSELVDL